MLPDKKVLYGLILLLVSISLTSPLSAAEQTHLITSDSDSYTIRVDGSREPVNEAIIIENVGDVPVVNPRISVNGKYNWFSIDTMLEEILAGCTTDEEKAFAIWSWILDKRFQRSPGDHTMLDPVLHFNVYGYGICGHTSACFKALAVAAGLKSRYWEIAGHTVSEAWWDGAWHMLDANVKIFYPKRDNRTVASVEQIAADPYLSERSRRPELTHMYTTTADNYTGDHYDKRAMAGNTMAITLRPGENMVRYWKPVSGKYEGNLNNPIVPPEFANGLIVWEPDMSQFDLAWARSSNIALTSTDGRKPLIHVDKRQGVEVDRLASFDLVVKSPYVVVGGKLDATVSRSAAGGKSGISILVTPDGPEAAGKTAYTYRYRTGPEQVELYLDPIVSSQSVIGRYGYRVRFAMGADGKVNPDAETGIEKFKITTDIQVAPKSLPALSLGENKVVYEDDTDGPHELRITHVWEERSDGSPPAPPGKAVSPKDGGKVKSPAPTLKWASAKDPDGDDTITDYHIQVSLRPDCRWPVCTKLDQDLGSNDTEFQIPESWLNPKTTYYWRVKAKDHQGNWSPWSKTWKFTTP
jgi:hypothetical protein